MEKELLRQDLVALGLEAGDVVMVHASLRRIGLARTDFGAGGADLLVDALEAAVGPTGTLMMVLGTDYAMDWVNERPEGERAGLLAGTPAFDYRNAPVLPEVGWLAEAFRRRPGTLTSDHPSGRFGARGPRAAALLADQPWHDYYGPGSPLEKLCDAGGRILRLGADPDTVTALHFAEYLADMTGKRRVHWHYMLAGPDGPRHSYVDCLNDLDGIVDYDGEDYFALILDAYRALCRHREGLVGKARSELIDAADIVAFGASWMEENLKSGKEGQSLFF